MQENALLYLHVRAVPLDMEDAICWFEGDVVRPYHTPILTVPFYCT
jgi:hypothetical protein